MEPWIALVGTVVGAVVGAGSALLAAHLQSRREGKHEAKRLILPKLEELHQLITDFRLGHRKEQVEMSSTLSGVGMHAPTAQEARPLPTAKLEMLVGFYAPGLKASLDVLHDRQEKFVSVYLEVMRHSRPRPEARAVHYDRAREASLALEEACDNLQAQTIVVARKYMSKGFHVSPE